MTFVSKIFGKIINKPVTNTASHLNAKEVVENVHLLEKEGFKDVKISQLGEDVVNLLGKNGNETYNISMNLANRSQVDTWSVKSYILDGFGSVLNTIKTAKGTMDGVIKSLRTVSKETTREGELLSETTELLDRVTGNHYKRVIDASGKATYYKNVDGDFIELFPKK